MGRFLIQQCCSFSSALHRHCELHGSERGNQPSALQSQQHATACHTGVANCDHALQDGTSKMSKSAENDNSRINMTDDPNLIVKKIKSAKTDAFPGLEWDNDDRPECQNLLAIYSIVTGKTKDEIATEVADMSWGTFKPLLADAVVEHLKPFQAKYWEVMEDRGELDRVLQKGALQANDTAAVTCERVRDAMGFLPPIAPV
jgi:tryptophanyl-tRNA synthetase